MSALAGIETVRVARVARLATVRPDGRPHAVPVTFAVVDDVLSFAIDDKPKRSTALQRLRNIEHQPRVCLLVDAYADDWSTLWWVRLDGVAKVVEDERERARLLAPLIAKYEQYRAAPPSGPVVAVRIETTTIWSADGRPLP